MKEKIQEVFYLDKVKEAAQKNITSVDVLEEDGWKTCIAVFLVDGAHGVYIPIFVMEMFGQEVDEDPYSEENGWIHDNLIQLEQELDDAINELIPMPGHFYFGYGECGDYCLFYTEECEDDEDDEEDV